jgi:hypothetical protein
MSKPINSTTTRSNPPVHHDPLEVEALIRSGQYFTTVATQLDKISLELKKQSEPQSHDLQLIVDELLYVQTHYKIKKRKIN